MMIMEIINRKKLGKTKKINHKFGKIITGTVNSHECKAAYIRLETWVTPTESLEASIAAIRRRFIANVYQVSKIYFEGLKSTIIDYDYANTKLLDKAGKKSFINIEITLLANDKFHYDKDFIFNAEMLGDNCFSLLESLSEHFTMSSSKK